MIPSEKLCLRCNIIKPSTDFYQRRNGMNLSSYCKSCMNTQTIERQRKFKQQCVEYKGGACQICGYNKCLGALEFHHINPSKKDFCISKTDKTRLNENICNELDKCILLCANCHREQHFLEKTKLFNVTNNPLQYLNIKHKENYCLNCKSRISLSFARCKECNINFRKKLIKKRTKTKHYCIECQKEISKQSMRCTNCHIKKVPHKTKIVWPILQVLIQEIKETSYSAVGRKYGVSDNAVRKHIKKSAHPDFNGEQTVRSGL